MTRSSEANYEQSRRTIAKDARQQLLADLPVRERRMNLAGIPTAVLEGGDGPPIILLHGPGEFALTWLRVLPDLVGTHHVVVPDLPGHGASLVGEETLDADRVLAWLEELIEQTCPSPPALAGHLLGGAIGARVASSRSNMLSRLLLVDTFGLRFLRPRMMFALTLIGFLARPTDGSRDRFFRQCFIDMDRLREELGERWEPLMTLGLQGAASRYQKTALRSLMPEFGLRAVPMADLARISIPTALIWGRHDRQTPLHVAEHARDRFGWPLHVIDDAADDPGFEQPMAFLGALRTALATSSDSVNLINGGLRGQLDGQVQKLLE
jgi:pimeloyl-ACP methyl ester carboxylesterase